MISNKIKLLLSFSLTALLVSGLSTFIVQFVSYYGLSYSRASSIHGYYEIARTGTSFFVAYILVRKGCRKTLGFSFLTATVLCLLLPLFDSAFVLALYVIFTGVIYTVSKISIFSNVSSLTETKEEHARFLNLLEACYMFSTSFGVFLFSYFIKVFPEYWLNIFYIFTLLSGTLTIFWIKPNTIFDSKPVNVDKHKLDFKSIKCILFSIATLTILIGICSYLLFEQILKTWMPSFLNHVTLINPHRCLEIAGLFALFLGLGRLISAVLLKYIPLKIFLVVNMIISLLILVFVFNMINPNNAIMQTSYLQTPLYVYLLSLSGFFIGPIYPIINSMYINSVDKDKQSMAVSITCIMSGMNITIFVKLLGIMFDKKGPLVTYKVFSIVPLIVVICTTLLFFTLTKQFNFSLNLRKVTHLINHFFSSVYEFSKYKMKRIAIYIAVTLLLVCMSQIRY